MRELNGSGDTGEEEEGGWERVERSEEAEGLKKCIDEEEPCTIQHNPTCGSQANRVFQVPLALNGLAPQFEE
jgi:hypothetical protein